MKTFGSGAKWFCVVFICLFCAPSIQAQGGLKAGSKAPDFELPTINGQKIALNSFLNKNIVILHFWKSK
jgi:hypothetical protein